PEPNLAASLASSISKRIERIDEALQFLLEDDPRTRAEEEILRDIQYWHDFGEDQPEGGYDTRRPEMLRALEERQKYMDTVWRPYYRRSPTRRWKQRTESLASQTNNANALQSFDSLRDDL